MKHGEGRIWQRRFWEHQIRDQDDYNARVEYIHYNPVKHGLAKAPKDWEYSSFSRYVKDGIYDREWGAGHESAFDGAIGNE
jgi:putative transposase